MQYDMIQHDLIQYDKSILYLYNTSAFHIHYTVTSSTLNVIPCANRKVFGFRSGINIGYFLFIFLSTELSNFEKLLLEKISNTLRSSVLTGV